MADVENLANDLRSGKLNGAKLSEMEKAGEISKSERRKIVRKSQTAPLTERQKLRLAVKEKKAQPRITKDVRRAKYLGDIEAAREKESANFVRCLNCKKRGHYLKDCPKAKQSNVQLEICFNCGSNDHILRNCPKARQETNLKFASCFICKKIGHISRDCPDNPNGLYPKGGCCHICLLKTHLVRDCPERTEEDKEMHRKRKQEAEDAKLGPRIAGLLASDENACPAAGDDYMAANEVDNDGDDDDTKHSSKKHKKSKSSKK